MKKLLLALFALLIGVAVNAQTITVLSPGGDPGEYYMRDSVVDIVVQRTGFTGQITLQYSTTGANGTYTTIATVNSSSTTVYSWTVPAVSSANCYIKAFRTTTPATFGKSPQPFRIGNPQIVVTAPNGGEIWGQGTNQYIEWTENGDNDEVNIYYSSDSGATWTTVANNLTASNQSYYWTVPSTLGTGSLVAVVNSDYQQFGDTSDAVFTINGPSVTLLTPNGGEMLTGNQSYNITWTSTGLSSWVILYYSINNGVSWNIIAYPSNTGTYVWTVPNVSTTNALIRIEDYFNQAYADQSNFAFEINAAVAAPSCASNLSPVNGANGISVGAMLSWDAVSNADTYDIYFGTSSNPPFVLNDFDNMYMPATMLVGTTYYWKIVPVNSAGAASGCSIYSFTTTSSGTNYNMNNSTVTTCTGNFYDSGGPSGQYSDGENFTKTFYPGTVGQYIQMNFSSFVSENGYDHLKIYDGTTATGTPIADYTGSITPGILTASNASGALTAVFTSDGSITAAGWAATISCSPTPAASVLTLIAPNGGESWNAGAAYNITWNSSNVASVKLEYSINGGFAWNTIVSAIANTGTYSWTILGTLNSCNARVRVSNSNNASIVDSSNANFCIYQPTLTFTSPVGGENYTGGSNVYSTYNMTGSISYVKAYYSVDSVNWTYITYYTANGYFNWTPPSNIDTCDFYLKIEDYYNAAVYTVSNAFCITAPAPSIVLNSLNGGQTILAGTSQYVSWTGLNTSGYYDLYYSIDGGTNWIFIDDHIGNTNYYWTVPSVSSCNVLFRVNDFANGSTLFDVSNNTFCIAIPNFTLTAPNGGESWIAGTSHTITWNSTNASAYVNLDYSINNGTSWTTINTVNNTGTYNWTVPNNPSCNARVRVVDYYTNSYGDTSNANFCINGPTPSLTLTTPNGGQSYIIGSSQYIYWSSNSISNVSLAYSSTGAAGTYTTITGSTNASNGNYYWNTAGLTAGCNYYIKVSDALGSGLSDTSNSSFCLVQPVITVTAPNGGEAYVAGTYQNITWTTSNVSSYVNIYYSTNGANYTLISTEYNDGSYSWYIPFNSSCNYTIKIEDYYSNTIYDVSNSTFCIALPAPSITVNYPNGGESFVVNTSTNITWNSVSVSAVNIDYSTNGGSTWTNLVTNYSTNNNYYNGSYYWNLSGYTASCNYRVRVTATANSAVTDMSNNNFCLIPPYVTVNAPNGGEVWGMGSYHYIYWNAPGVSQVNIEYSTNGGATFQSIPGATGITASSNYFNWLIPSTTASTQCLVRVKDSSNPTTIYDISNNYFTIPAPSITLTAPNGGQNYGIGTGQYIYWSSTSVANVNITYSADSGVTWNNVATNVNAANGYYYWTVPNTPSNNVLIQVTDASNSSLYDASNAVFTIITPVITLTSPNGGESWMGTTTHAITWSSYGLSSYVNLYYSVNNGSTWNAIVTGIYNSGSYNWYVPNNASCNALIRVMDYSYNSYQDISNANFCITAPTPTITLTAPNGGQVWGIGSTQNIYWNSISVTYVNLYYSINNGSTWSTIANNVQAANGSYAWSIPNTPSQNCLVKVADASNVSLSDSSNARFTIPVPSITLTTPNGGENWGSGSTQYIYWNSASIPAVKIEYSTNNGVLWNTIVNSTNGYNGSYAWLVPTVSSSQCKVRVSSTTNAAVNDASNSTFTISIPVITVTFPNGGEQLVGLTYKPINWTSTATSNYVNIQYSTDGGTNWSYVASGVYNTGTYNWYIPNTPTTLGKVRVSDYYNNSVIDVSNANFTINAANSALTVSYPNGGENFLVGNSYNIYWSATSVQNVKIEYTIDNGVNWILISASTPATNGSYYWATPNVISNLCRVKVSDLSNLSLNDISNNVFSISQPIPSLSLTSPNGGENWTIGGYNYITWSANNINGVNILLSKDSGATWNALANNVGGGYYYYNVTGPASSACYVKVIASNISSLMDSSAADFNIDSAIVNNNTLSIDTLTSLAYCKGDTLSVPFTASGVFNPGNYYEVQLSDSSGSFANPTPIGSLSSVLDSGNIAASIPTNILNGINYMIRVVASDLTTIGTPYAMPIIINSPEFDFTPSTQLRKYLPDGNVNFVFVGDTTGIADYRWEFGNGDTAVTVNASHAYDQIGFYTVTMTATSNAGCSSTITKYDLIDIEQIFPSIDLGNIGSGNQLNGVAASSANGDTLYAVGNNGIIISSIDGGITWYSIPGVPTANYSGVTIAGGASTGTYICVSGNAGYLAFSNNGGQTWSQVSNAATGSADYNDVNFSTFNNGFGVGTNGSIVHYDGTNWTNQSSLVNNSSAVFNAVATSGPSNAMVVGNGGIAYLYNGTAWTSIATSVTTDLHAVYYISGTTWYAAGDNGLIIKTTDNGTTWTNEFGGIASRFTSIAVDPINNTVWAVGDNGVVYQKLDTGSFERYSIGNTTAQRGASYKSGKGVIVGDGGVGYRFGATAVAVGDLGATSFCAGSAISIPVQVSGQFNLGNTFTAQLSDATGDFTTPSVLGSLTSNIEGTIVGVIPASTANGTAYRIRIVSTDTALVGTDNGVDLSIHAAPVVNLGLDLAPCAGDTVYLDALNSGSTYFWSNDSITQSIMITASGTYTVMVTNYDGCTTADSAAVNYIDSQFTIDLGSDIASCNASGVTLDAGISGLDYVWSTLETTQSIQVTTSGQYIVTANKCSFTDTDTIMVQISAPATVDLGADTSICTGTIILVAPSGTGYSYLWSDNSTNDSLIVTTLGNYSVSVTTLSGCVTTDQVNITIGAYPVVNLGNDTAICVGSSLTLSTPSVSSYTYLWTNSTTGNIITVNAAGTYGVTVTSIQGCATTDNIVVSAAAMPVVNLGNDTSVCGSKVLTAPAGTGYTYLWSNGATTQTITVTGVGAHTESVTVTNAAGCSSTDAITVTIMSGLANAPVISQTGNTMSTTTATSYQWNYSGVAIAGATSATYTTTVAGIYTVTVNGGVGCNTTSADYLFNPSGIVSLNANGSALSIAPNPTNGKFNLSFELKANQNVTVKVTDVLGREVYTENMNSFVGKFNKAIDLANFANGVYTVNVIMDEASFVEKVVLQK